ncbi:putative Clr5 domain-containing protein [Seiridium cardinale]
MPSKPTQKEWEKYFDTLHRLYIQEGWELPDVRIEMEKLGFYASKSQYEARFKAWGFQKNLSADTWKYVGHELKKRKRDDKDSEVIVLGTCLPPSKIRKETSRHFYDTKYLVEHANVPSPPGVDVEVFTPVEIKMESFISPSLPFNRFRKYLQQLFPDLTTPFDMVTQRNGPLPVNKNGKPFKSLQMDPISRVLLASNLHEHNTDDLATYLGILMPESFIGEHLLRAEALARRSDGVAARAQLELLVYITSNIIGDENFFENDERNKREERLLDLIRNSGVMKMRIHPGDSVLEEPTFDAFLEKLFAMVIRHRETDVISWLLGLGVDPNSSGLFGNDLTTHLPLLSLVKSYQPSIEIEIEISNILLSHGASPTQFCCEDHGTALEFAAQCGQVTILKALIEHLEKLGDFGFNSTLNINTLINLAAGCSMNKEGAYQTIQYLISIPRQIAHDASVEFTLSTALINAIRAGNEKLVLLLHDNGANMNFHDRLGGFPLEAALRRQLYHDQIDTTMCELLISLGASPNYDPSGEAVIKLPSALHYAARYGLYEACKLLLDNDAQLHYPAQFEKPVCGDDAETLWTPLQVAIVRGHTSCATLLIHHDAFLIGDELLCAVRECDELTPSLVDALIKAGINITLKSAIGETALHTSIRREFFDVARTLIHAGAVVDFQLTTSLVPWIDEVGPMSELYNVLEESKTTSDLGSIMSIDDFRPLLQAIESRDSRAIHLATRCLEKRLWPRRYISQTLIIAIATRNFEITRILLNRFPTYYDPEHLHEAMYSIVKLGEGDDYAQHLLFITEILKRRNARYWYHCETRAIRQAVKLACRHGDFRPLELLLAHLPGVPTADTWSSEELLYEPLGFRRWSKSPISPWDRKTLESLFTAGCRPNTTVGLLAICAAPMEQVKQLMEYGFDPRQRYSWSSTSLQHAAVLGRSDMVRMLLKYGVNVNARPAWKFLRFYPLQRCARRLWGDPTRTALQAAVEKGNLEIMNMLLDAGADINASPGPFRGATTLQLAAIKGYIGIAKSLISMGANINADGAKCFGRTALEGAAEAGRLDMVHFLLEEGCIIDNHRRRQYIRAIFLARSRGHHALAQDDEPDYDILDASKEDDESDWNHYVASEEKYESISDEILEPEYGNREQESLDDGQEGAAGWGSGNDNDCIFDVGGDDDIHEVPWI